MKQTSKKEYSVPRLEVEELEVERGFSLSSNYGGPGEAGQGSGYLDSDFEL
uniref:hypothetical protein n=1 Tax=Alistipes sp. TaxID=1872444 RepID=UPI00405709BF